MKTIRIWLASVALLVAAGRVDAIAIGCCICNCANGVTQCTDTVTIGCLGLCEEADCTEQGEPPVQCSEVPGCPQAEPPTGAPALGSLGLGLGIAAVIGSGGAAWRRRRRQA
jgi:hypothetical protein